MPMRQLAIDVGNTRIKLASFDVPFAGKRPSFVRRSIASLADWEQFSQAIAQVLEDADPATPSFVAGANPAGIRQVVRNWPGTRSRPLVVDRPDQLPLEVHLNEPGGVGIDRLLNAVAANLIRPPDRPAIVIDAGTATTVDMVSAAGAFLGGAILPGLEIAARALHQETALLPLLAVDQLPSAPQPLGTDTQSAMWSGLYWGHVGGVQTVVRRLCKEVFQTDARSPSPLVLLTGGAARCLASQLSDAVLEPDLSLQGLAVAGCGILSR